MRRIEAVTLVVSGLVSLTAGLTWMVGPVGLVTVGAALVGLPLFVFDVKE